MLTHLINLFLRSLLIASIFVVAILSRALAQNKSYDSNQIHLKMSKEVNGVKSEIDTVFNNSSEADAFIKKFNGDESDLKDEDIADKNNEGSGINNFNFRWNDDSAKDKNNTLQFNFNMPQLSSEEEAKLDKDLDDLKQELKRNLHSFDMHWDSSSEGNQFNYNFNFKMPDEKDMEELKEKLNDMDPKALGFDFDFMMPDADMHFKEPAPAMPNFNFDVQGLSDADKQKFEEQMKKAEAEYKKAMDMLKEKNGSVNVNPPTDTKTQKKIIIIEKSSAKTDPKKNSGKGNDKTALNDGASPDFKINDFKCFPNPNNGKFDVSFNLPSKGNLNVSIIDITGREFYSETLENFDGDYSQSFDITQNEKGVYLLKISQGKQWFNKRIVVK